MVKERALTGKDGLPVVGKWAAWYELERRQYEKENEAAKRGISLDPETMKKYFQCPLCNSLKTNKCIMPSQLLGEYHNGSPVKVRHVVCCFECRDTYARAGASDGAETTDSILQDNAIAKETK